MNYAVVDKIVRAVLYEGHMLYPYRPSVKNHHRWMFGTLYPKSYSEKHGGSDLWMMQTECLVAAAAHACLRVELRFLHLVSRTLGQLIVPSREFLPEKELTILPVNSLEIDGKFFRNWEETVERNIHLFNVPTGDLDAAIQHENIVFEYTRDIEPLRNADGLTVGLMTRQRQPLSIAAEIETRAIANDLYKVTIRISNTVTIESLDGVTRDHALARSLLSTHLILNINQGEFISLIDPPARWRQAAQECRNIGAFPVLVGAEGEKDTVLSSPIILYDYPQVAPESSTEFFDACEIDELLALRVATMTDHEKQEMLAVDERTRAILARTQSMNQSEMSLLHGAVRQLREVKQMASDIDPETPRLTEVKVGHVNLRAGDCVRLRPRRSADGFDMLLSGRIATIASIEQDFEDRIQLAVTLNDDPGADLGAEGKIGHRFFFFPDEVEPLTEGQAGGP